ncbi:MAG: sugar phosphate isomerase/epimerase family protein [bacterium]
MKYSCYLSNAFIENSPISTREWFEFAPRVGLDGIELIPIGWPLDWWKLKRMKEDLKRVDLEVSMVSIGNNFCVEEDQREVEIDRMEAYAALAQEFGSKLVRVMAGRWDRDAMLVSRSKAIRMITETFKECLDRIEKYNVILALENHPGDAGLFLDVFLEILQRVRHPNLGVNFDTGNARRAGQNPMDFLREREITDRMVHLHVKDFKGTPDGWVVTNPIDGDVVNHREIFSVLKRKGYDGWISWEHAYARPSRENLDEVARVIPYLKRLWEES